MSRGTGGGHHFPERCQGGKSRLLIGGQIIMATGGGCSGVNLLLQWHSSGNFGS